MADIYSLYTQNGVPVANKIFEKIIFQNGLKLSPLDLTDFQDIIIRDFDNFLFATRGQVNGIYKTEYEIETEELIAGLEVSLQKAEKLSPSSNYELKINKGKAYIGGKLVIVPLDDYIEVPDNDMYPDFLQLYLILERNEIYFEPTAIGEPGYAITDGQHTSNRYENGYIIRLVENLPTEVDQNGTIKYIKLARLERPTILKTQSDISLDKLDGIDDSGINWNKYESNLHILNTEKVIYLYNGIETTKILYTITQEQWDSLHNGIVSSLTNGVYYVPYTKNVLIVSSGISQISQERIWYMPHTSNLSVIDERYIMEDLPSVISAAFEAVNDLTEHKTNFFSNYIPYGLNNGLTPGSSGIQDTSIPDYNENGRTFWVLPIAESEPINIYLGEGESKITVSPSNYVVTNNQIRTYNIDGNSITKELGRIVFNVAPSIGQRLTIDFYHDAHTLYVENTKHEAHRNALDAHPLYINNTEMSEHLINLNDTYPIVVNGSLPFKAHDNRYYSQSQLDSGIHAKAPLVHNHNTVYSQLGHEHQVSEIQTLQEQLVKLENNLGVFDKTTSLIFENIEEGVDGIKDHFIIDSLLMQDETIQLIGVKSDLTGDIIDNPVILTLLKDPSNITGRIDSLSDNYTLIDNYANFPIGMTGSITFLDIDNKPVLTSAIVSNTTTTIRVVSDIHGIVILPIGEDLGSKYIVNLRTITSLESNYIIKDSGANFPTDDRWVGGNIQVTDNLNIWHTYKILSNTINTITLDKDISGITAIGRNYLVNDFTEGGINPWSEPQKVSFGGNNLGLVISAVQQDDEVWSLWVDTLDAGLTHNLWWSTRKKEISEEGESWSPPINTGFNVDSDCRPSIVLLPNESNPLNQDLLWLFSEGHSIRRSLVTYGQTNYSTPSELFYGSGNIYAPEGIFIDRGGNNEIWLIYVREDNGYNGIFLRRFYTNNPYSGIIPYNTIGSEIKLSVNNKNCYHPTISQELTSNGNIWVAWGEDNSDFDNRKKPIIKILNTNAIAVISSQYIPIDITTYLSELNNDSKMELHHSTDGDVWLVYSKLVGGAFKVFYTLLRYESLSNNIVNVTPPVELNWGHQVSITERSDNTIWINYNQATQVYSQIRTLGNGEVKWIRSTGDLILEKAPENNTSIELRWQLPFVNIESRLEAVESELRTQSQKLEEIESRVKEYHEGTTSYIDDTHWLLPIEYVVNKASNLRIFVNGLRLRSVDWSLNDSTITFINNTPIVSKIIVEWNQIL
jgi:hypothetical protein